MNWLLAGCLLLVIICAAVGYKRGLVKVLFSLISFVAVMLVVGIISPLVGDFLEEKTSLPEVVNEKCVGLVQEWNLSAGADTAENRILAVDSSAFPEPVKQYLKEDVAFSLLETDFTSYLSSKMTSLVIDAIAYAVSFLVVWIAFRLIAGLLDLVAKLPVLNTLNRCGGLAAGAVQGILLVWVFFLIITIFCTTDWGRWCMERIAESRVLTYIYDKNLILRLIPGLRLM